MAESYENIRRALALLDSEDAFDRAAGHATLRDQCHPDTIRALLAERDALDDRCLMLHAAYNAEARKAERLEYQVEKISARASDLAAWLKSGNDVPADLPFVFRERWQKITADIRALEAAIAAANGGGNG